MQITKKHIELFAKYAGLVTVCFEWLAVLLFFILKPAYFNGEYPISYFASLPETRIIFSVCLTIAATTFWVFTQYHLNRYYIVPVRLFAASMLGYAVLALTPFNPNDPISDVIHRILALFFLVTFLAGIYLMGKHNIGSNVRRMSYLAVGLSSLVTVLFLITPKNSQFVLLLEAMSAFIGQLWVIWISFHSFKAETKKSG
jgi:hypothetical protein